MDVNPILERVQKLTYGKIDWSDYIAEYKRYEDEFRGFISK